jgi:L-alanine-DL-glutamate epimerase-like enolase superfamily enzyme
MAALQRMTRALVGKAFTEPSPLLAQMRFDILYWAMRGLGAQCTSAVEAALWDIWAQAQGKPLWQMLGDGKPHSVLVYASGGLGTVPPEEIYEEAKDYAGQGFRAFKIRAGDPDLNPPGNISRDIERVAAAREALGPDRMLLVDLAVPQRPVQWAFEHSAAYAEAIRPYKARFLEEPALTYDVAMYRRIQALGLTPTAGGECFCTPEEFEPFFAAQALGVAQPDAAVVGGPASCVQVMRRAQAFGVDIALHAWCAGVGLAQNLHAACSLPNILVMEYPVTKHRLASEPLREIWKLKDGYLQAPSQPGLGVVVAPELLQSCAFQKDVERNF